MAAYYQVDVVLNSQAVTVGLPSPQSVTVTLPTVGPAGPQGPAGASQADVLTVQGDLLYRGASAAQRLGIGTFNQILKVSSGGLPEWGAAPAAGVSSVNGETGAVTLDASDVGAVPTSRTISSGTGLTGGGDLTANRTLAVAYGTTAGTACEGNDGRLSDSRTPTAHTHGNITNDGKVGSTSGLPLKTGTAGVVEAGAFGTSAGQFAEGNHTHTTFTSLRIDGGGGGVVGSLVVGNTTSGQNNYVTIDTAVRFESGSNNGYKSSIAATALTENRSVQLPNASGTLALTSDIPANTISSTLVDAKGDLIVATAADTVARLPVGATNGHVLTVDSAEAGGMKWAAASGGVTAVGSTVADILSVSGSDLVADDLGADKLYGWDDSEGKAIGYVIGSGLSVSGDTLSATASGPASQTDVFTANGTWTKPAGAKLVHYLLIGGGGGGGAGRRSLQGNSLCGGGGGAGGGITAGYVDPVFLGTTETITVGAGGTGASDSADNTNGATGSGGGDSSFGSFIKAKGGNAGGGGSSSLGAAGTATTLASLFYGTNASTAAGAAGAGSSAAPSNAAASVYLPTGGGGGGARGSSLNGVGSKGGDIGQTNTGITSAPAIAAASNGPAGIRSQSSWAGTGGGGGSMSSDNAVYTGFSGGNGGLYGGGGGGGSGAVNASGGSTAGGSGGQGIVIVTTYF